jgi:trimeric autotransporter adhesin
MKNPKLVLLLAAVCLVALTGSAAPLGTTFTYQGRLTDAGGPATGTYDLRFILYSADAGGSQIGPVRTNSPTAVSGGLFTVGLDFGAGIFDGNAYWLEISVRTNGGGAFVPLNPRQPLTPAPYAITAGNVSGTVSAAQLSGAIGSANVSGTYGNAVTFGNAGNSFNGSGAGLTGLNASELAGGLVPDARLAGNVARTNQVWLLGGNRGTTAGTHFLGTTDSQALDLRVNGAPALRLEPTTNSSMVNVIGGSSGNYVDPGVVGATIAGGGTLNYFGNQDTNRVAANFGVIGGGADNFIAGGAGYSVIAGGSEILIDTGAVSSTIGGGNRNVIRTDATSATIAGGFRNTIETNSNVATIAGGSVNTIQANADYATIGGGLANVIQSNAANATIAGGGLNTIQTHADLSFIGGGNLNSIEANADRSVIGGGTRNTNGGAVAFIGGGAANLVQTGATYAVIGGGFNNTNGGMQAFIGGGFQNFAGGPRVVIGGGYQNVATNSETTIGGGANNFAGGWNAAIGGGALNTASGDYSFVGAGFQNQATTNYATVPGGYGNRANGDYSLAAGRFGRADHRGAFVWADSLTGNFASTTSNQFSVRANGGVRLVTGGTGMTLDGQPVLSATSTITSNQLADGAVTFGKIADGVVGTAQISDGSIRSGDLNLLSFATTFWKADGNSGTTAGANFIGTTDGQPLEFKVNSQRGLRLEPGASNSVNVIGGWAGNGVAPGLAGATVAGGGAGNYSGLPQTNKVTSDFGTVGGGWANTSSGFGATVAGGGRNSSSWTYAVVGGGLQNNSSDYAATIGGGLQNNSSGTAATVGGGWGNTSSNLAATVGGGSGNKSSTNYATVGGGLGNDSSGYAATVGGGWGNASSADYATVGGGLVNTSSGNYAMVPGGNLNNAAGDYSFAAGHRAKANHIGSFVWADDHNFDFASTAANKVRFRCTSGFDIITAIDGSGNQTAGVFLSPGDTSWNVISDRDAKKNLQPVDAVAVLNKLADIPIAQWNYKWESETNTPHLGPMAQDFKAAFYPGRDDKSISTLEFDGVELAAIQGLNQKVEEQAAALKTKDAEIKELRQSMAELKALVAKLARE